MRPNRRLAQRASLVAIFAALLTLLFAGAPAAARDSTDQIAASLRSDDRVYVADGAISPGQERRIEDAVRQAESPFFVVIQPRPPANGLENLVVDLRKTLQENGTYIAMSTNQGGWWVESNVVSPDETRELMRQVETDHRDELVAGLAEFVSLQDNAATPDESSNGGGSGMGSWIALAILLLIVVGIFALATGARRQRRRREVAQLAEVRPAAEEDVTRLGEDIAGLDLQAARTGANPEMSSDYQLALDSYDRAKDQLAGAKRPADMRSVTEALAEGRYAMACVRARINGEPVPERRPPCFFNPQHGPSTKDVEWTPAGGTPRSVPVCAADADRLARGDEPQTRNVLIGGERRPYWEGGPAYAPWFGGYYAGYGMSGLLPGLLIGTALGSDWGYGAGFDDAGAGAGDFGGGGGDFGGDFGGGGGDFGGGGGDFGGGFDGGGF